MHAGSPSKATYTGFPLSVGARAGIVALALACEALPLSYLIQGTDLDLLSGIARTWHESLHWLFRFAIAYAACVALLGSLRPVQTAKPAVELASDSPLRLRFAVMHLLALLPLTMLSSALFRYTDTLPFLLVLTSWLACGAAAIVTLFATLAPLSVWRDSLARAGRIPLYALAPAAIAVIAIGLSQRLWVPAAELTFRLVALGLRPFLPGLLLEPATRAIGTQSFIVDVSERCSGLEGVGLMLAFTSGWLWYFRRDYYFPRALLVIPLALAAVFALNVIRIGAIVLIGAAGYERVAMVGFHSQAGWIAFNVAALAVALLAKRSRWLNRTAHERARAPDNPTAAFLVPLLSILATGMLTTAVLDGVGSTLSAAPDRRRRGAFCLSILLSRSALAADLARAAPRRRGLCALDHLRPLAGCTAPDAG